MAVENEMNEFGFDMNVIYIRHHGHDQENQSGAAQDRTVIDLERYKILKTMRMVMNAR
jgi:hypothetical protein